MNACPFGAIFEISQTFDVLQRIKKGEKMVAIIAPSILGQFKTSIEQVYGAFKEIGFTDIIEVAEGAMMTTSNEAHELLEKLEEGQKFMTTSCCPSYIELVEKHLTEMKPYVSTTGSPMYYAARIAKEKHPDAKIVFVGPCVAKRKEVRRDEAVDYILTFEEVGSILDGMDIQLEQVDSFSILHTSVREAHGFAQAGGVMGAVKAYLKEEADKIKKAQMARGADFESGNLIQKAKSMVPLLVPLFVSAFRRATDLAMAMEARCYRGGEGRTKMKPLKYAKRDHMVYGAYLVYFVAAIVLKVLL